MSTPFVTTIKSSGGDYASLSAWEAGQQCNLTLSNELVFSGNLVGSISQWASIALYSGGVNQSLSGYGFVNAANNAIFVTGITSGFNYATGMVWAYTGNTGNYFTLTTTGDTPIAVAECYSMNDTTAVTINGWTTSPSNYIQVYTPLSERHSGVWSTGKYSLITSATTLTISTPNIIIDGLQLSGSAGGWGNIYNHYSGLTGNVTISNNILQGAVVPDSNYGGIYNDVIASSGILNVYNNLIYGWSGANAGLCGYSNAGHNTFTQSNLYNNLFHCKVGVALFLAPTLLNNNIFYQCNVDPNNNNALSGTDYNVTDATGIYYVVAGSTNTHDKVSQNFSFINAANNDFRLSSYDTGAIFNATSLSGIFTTDSIGTSRGTGTVWDAGPYHPTIFIRTIKPSGQGGNYISLNAWQAGEQRNLQGVNKIAIAEIDGTWTGTSDTVGTTIAGWNSNNNNYVLVRAVNNARHSGVWDDNKYRYNYTTLVVQDVTYLSGLQFQKVIGVNDFDGELSFQTPTYFLVDSCLIKGILSSTANSTYGLYCWNANNSSGVVRNSVFYNFYNGTGNVNPKGIFPNNCSITAYNTLFYNCYNGYYSNGGSVAVNCLAQGCVDGFVNTFTNSSNNCSDISGDAPGTNSFSGTATFLNAATEDFRLSPYDTGVMFKGTGLSSIFTTDIAGNNRGAGTIWDVGASQPTTSIRTIRPSGQVGNYNSLAAWEAGESRNLVNVNKIARAEIGGNWSGISPDNGVTINGWVSNPTNFIDIYTLTGANHSGVWNPYSFYVTGAVSINETAVNISGIQFVDIYNNGNQIYVVPNNPTGQFYFDRLLVKGQITANGSSCGGMTFDVTGSYNAYVRNSTFYDIYYPSGGYFGIYVRNGGNVVASNCTFFNCNNGIGLNNKGSILYQNVLAQKCDAGFFGFVSLLSLPASTNNVSDDNTAPPFNTYYTGITVKFIDSGNRDLRLSPYDTGAIFKGSGISYAFSGDIAGTFRGTGNVWDVGAHHPPSYIRTIRPSGQGGNYISLNAWQAGEQKNLQGVNKVAIAEIDGTWTGTSDTAGTTIAGWNSNNNNYVLVRAVNNARHSGIWDDNKYRYNYQTLVIQDVAYFSGLQFQKVIGVNDFDGELSFQTPTYFLVDSCLIKGILSSAANSTYGLYCWNANNSSGVVRNSVFYNFYNGTGNVNPKGIFSNNCSITAYNTLFYNCYNGYYSNGGSVAVNCLAQGCVDGFVNTFVNSSNNCSDISGDAPGTNSLSGTVTFMNAATGDFRLSPYDTYAILKGTGLSNIFQNDASGYFRGTGVVWDIGPLHSPTYNRTIKPSGQSGNYISLNAWQAGEQRDLVACNKIANAEIGGLWSAPETNLVSINGWNTSWTNYLNVYTTGQARHSGIITGSGNFTGYYRLENGTAFTFVLYNYTDFSRFDGLALCGSGAQTYGFRSDAATYSQLTNTIIYNSQNGLLFYLSTGYLNNCIIQNCSGDASSSFAGTAFGAGGGGPTQMYCDNCVAINNKYGFSCAGFRAIHVTNCYAGGNTSGDYFIDPNAQWTVTNSYSSDGTTGGVITLANAKFMNSTPWHEDLRLQQGSALIGTGVNLTGNASWINPYGYTDISGAAWPTSGAWNVGPFAGFVIVSVPLDVWPISDVNTGNWTIPPLWSKINANNGDIDWISSPYSPSNETCEVMLSGITSPNITTGHYVQYRFQKENGAGTNYNLIVGLYNGASLIASGVHTGIANGWITTGFTLTTGQASNITDYTNLRLRFTAYTG